ncbi:MAG TPA: hypothetical protein VM846_18475 [Vicinamibacterales bacterium]|nr:hypothetical protein [Vicinamibacterales bacterium]
MLHLRAMEIRDGFIVGVHNYCDAWCDRCTLTSHCRVFADMCELEAADDPNLKPVVDAPRHPDDEPEPTPSWLQELLDEINIESERAPKADSARRLPRVVPEGEAIEQRADAYLRRTRAWLQRSDSEPHSSPGEPLAVISWFHMVIHVKAMRALHGLAEDDRSWRDWPADHDGSAKVALIGIDQSHRAWRDLVEVGRVPPAEAAPFLHDLVWLRSALERTFPKARAFVRPGFDEPAEVARLLQST